jgi:hypothetical protein
MSLYHSRRPRYHPARRLSEGGVVMQWVDIGGLQADGYQPHGEIATKFSAERGI